MAKYAVSQDLTKPLRWPDTGALVLNFLEQTARQRWHKTRRHKNCHRPFVRDRLPLRHSTAIGALARWRCT